MPFTWKLRKEVQFNFNQDKILPLSDPSADTEIRRTSCVLTFAQSIDKDVGDDSLCHHSMHRRVQIT